MRTRSAKCSCGALSAVAVGDPLRVSVCHCIACQRRTGSVFGAQAAYRQEAVSVHGPSTTYVRVGDAGNRIAFHFCPTCGSTVWYQLEGRTEVIAIPVGAFADPTFPPPTSSGYDTRKHAWVVLPEMLERLT